MTQEQWQQLLAVIDGARVDPFPVGFIIDSPWLPNWAGHSILDYFASETVWLEANLKALREFPDVMFLPGFWSEYGMCTEPSAFGAKCVFFENDFPFAGQIPDALEHPRKPDPNTDGLAPFMIKRLVHTQSRIAEAGHAVRFAVARGPLNIAGFLMGNTDFLVSMRMQPEETLALIGTITDYLVEWIQVQAKAFPSIDGIFILDDIVGFCGEDDFNAFAREPLKRIFQAIDARVRFLHNDAHGLVCAPHLAGIGVNLFNFSFLHPMAEMQQLAGEAVTLLGNIPPRDVLAVGAPEEVYDAVKALIASLPDPRRVVLSAGGGMAPGTPSENIRAFLEAAGH